MRNSRTFGMVMAALVAAACGSDDGAPGDDDGAPGGSLTVSGTVVDFVTGMPVEGATSVTSSGLAPLPRVTVQGPSFEIAGVPANSVFHVLAASAPSHRATFGPAIAVTGASIEDVSVPVLSEVYLAQLASAFAVTPQASQGVLLAQVVDENGQPQAGVSGAGLAIDNAGQVVGPYFLDQELQPAPQATATSESGYLVWFALDAGLAGMSGAPGADLVVDMPVSPIAAGAATLTTVRIRAGAAPPPANVSFAQQIVPIFARRGCEACHSGNGIGKDLGGLTLDGSVNLIYKELVEELPARVSLVTPAQSLVLTMPSREDPADGHPNVTFTSELDPDYVLIHAWIQQGALEN